MPLTLFGDMMLLAKLLLEDIMATLNPIPDLIIPQELLKKWGSIWLGTVGSNDKDTGMPTKKAERFFDKKQGMDFGKSVDPHVAKMFAEMLGNIPVIPPISGTKLLPPMDDCVELGDTRLVGGVRTQNYDIMYRPDSVRIAYDSKTLNASGSLQKNWHNMVNDLASEATTVHTRFPYALALFLVLIPKDIFSGNTTEEIVRTLERLNCRKSIREEDYKAESIALIIWNPHTGEIDRDLPEKKSSLRWEKFGSRIEATYLERYAGLPPHTK